MTERHELRWGGFAGFAFVVLAVVAALMPAPAPRHGLGGRDPELRRRRSGRLMVAALLPGGLGRPGDLVRRGFAEAA